MYKNTFPYIRIFLVIALFFTILGMGLYLKTSPVNSATDIILPEGADFATRVLGQPWDMSEYSQISQLINQSGQSINLGNISVDDGVFSAKALNTDAWFYPLFPGYDTAMLVGKVGHNYPIDPYQYACLYMAAKIDSAPTIPTQIPDVIRAFWFADDKLNNGPFGGAMTFVEPSDPHMTSTPPRWEIHKMNLVSDYFGGSTLTKWIGDPKHNGLWEGLRINPTTQPTTFAVDWIRLTDCKPVNLQLTNLTAGDKYSFFLVNDEREILVEEFSAGSSTYNIDMEGVAAGSYTYKLKKDGTIYQNGTATIVQTPLMIFSHPSVISGEDYAASVGNPWDFTDWSDITKINDLVNTSLSDGIFNFTTHSNSNGIMYDGYIEVNSPEVIPSAAPYRYLSFQMRTDGPWQNVPEAMIVRWAWHVVNPSKGQDCWMVSQDIPYDVGWQVVTVDLWDPFNGLMEENQGHCNGVPSNWKDMTNVVGLRIDPNENIMGVDLVQALDWITLTKEDEVRKGDFYGFDFSVSKPSDQVNINFFYTTNRLNQNQHPMKLKQPARGQKADIPRGSNLLFVPLVYNHFDSFPYHWDTTYVSPGQYYLCVTVQDKLIPTLVNTTCSDATVNILP